MLERTLLPIFMQPVRERRSLPNNKQEPTADLCDVLLPISTGTIHLYDVRLL